MTATESLQPFLKLERSTAECAEGPEVLMRPGRLTVRYDTEAEGGPEWTTLQFPGAVAVRVTPEPAVSALASGAYSMVAIVGNSMWLASLTGLGTDGNLPADLKHFLVFFDHYGAIEAIARTCEVKE
jgi:hypothetical protein